MSEGERLTSILEGILAEIRRANDIAEARLREAERDTLYTPSEAAEYMGRTKATLCNYVSRGYLHKVIRGGRQGYLKSEMDKITKK